LMFTVNFRLAKQLKDAIEGSKQAGNNCGTGPVRQVRFPVMTKKALRRRNMAVMT